MSQPFPPDIEALIDAQMATGNYQSQNELLKAALEQLAAQNDELSAIEQSIDLLDAGDPGIPLDDVFAGLRAKYDIPTDA